MPAAAEIVLFNDTSDKDVNIDMAVTIAGMVISSGYDGAIDAGSHALTINGSYEQSGGTFTAPAGLMAVSGGFQHTGGTFDPNGGRVVLDNTTDQTLATTFYDLYLNDGLLGYWKLDEGTGTTAADVSSYGYDGTLNGGPAWITDTASAVDFYDPYALHLDRSPADYVDIPGTTDIDNLQELTLSVWVRLDTTPGDVNMRFITLRNEKAVLRYKDTGGTGKLQFYMDIGGGLQNFEVNHTWATGTWYHLAGTYDGGTMRLYVNGVEQPGAVSAAGLVGTGDGVYLGWSGSDGALDGALDDVRVYNRALSGTEIQSLADGGHPQTSVATTTLGTALDVGGDLTLNSGTLDVSASDYGINAAGDFTYNGGVFTPQGGTVTLDGSSPQNMDAAGIDFNDLTVNSGVTLVDLSGLKVNGALTNNGTLQRTQVVNGSSGVNFFTTGGYGGVNINAMNSDLGSTVVKIHGNQDCTTVAGETVQRCFEISPENTTGRQAFIRFYFALSELSGNTCETLEAYHGTGGNNWEQLTLDPGYWGDDGRSCTGDGLGPPYGVAVREVSDFSSFVLKSGDDPNAVTLARFTARLAGGGNGFVLLLALAALGAVGVALVLQVRRRLNMTALH